ncbi:hypothetical protein FBU59_006948, partial [Linderina macrospora]
PRLLRCWANTGRVSLARRSLTPNTRSRLRARCFWHMCRHPRSRSRTGACSSVTRMLSWRCATRQLLSPVDSRSTGPQEPRWRRWPDRAITRTAISRASASCPQWRPAIKAPRVGRLTARIRSAAGISRELSMGFRVDSVGCAHVAVPRNQLRLWRCASEWRTLCSANWTVCLGPRSTCTSSSTSIRRHPWPIVKARRRTILRRSRSSRLHRRLIGGTRRSRRAISISSRSHWSRWQTIMCRFAWLRVARRRLMSCRRLSARRRCLVENRWIGCIWKRGGR